MIEFLQEVFDEFLDRDAIIWKDQRFSYAWVNNRIVYWQSEIQKNNILPGSIIALEADFSPNAVALFLTLIEHRCILVPLTSSVASKRQEFLDIAGVEISYILDESDKTTFKKISNGFENNLFQDLRNKHHPGLVLFSSGSTGKSKAAVHDLTGILEKFKTRRFQQCAITFLLYDHIGGVNTMLHILSNGGTIVTIQDRSPDSVLSAIEKYQVELLPTSPTFINLILISEAYKRHNLESLKIITYGTEPMQESTLKRFHGLFPKIKLQQTYGLSEVGILRSKSLSSDSLWVKIGGEGFETRVVDGILQIKAQSAMLGYLNAPSPFTDDGWFNTGDEVEIQGEYFRILGRKSEIINVGGEKVYPAEVESILQDLDNIAEATVYGESNPITGNIVCAKVRIKSDENPKDLIIRIKKACSVKLPRYKIPVKIKIVSENQYSDRFKKMRSGG